MAHVVKRNTIPLYKSIIIRAIAVIAAFLISGVLFCLLVSNKPQSVGEFFVKMGDFFQLMLEGAFKTKRRIWLLFYDMALLLCISLAVTPAFKMKFWNIGAEGQALVAGLACAGVMLKLGGKVPSAVLWIIMAVASVTAGIVWAVIPALFKAKWNTNETLFTLMMNYIATQLVTFFISVWVTSQTGKLPPMKKYSLPTIGNEWLLNIILIAVLTAVMYVYLRFSKHGYEIAVVGESQNTARYIGINVKKVIIRTMVLSGAVCGLMGLFVVGGTDYTISKDTISGRGFTAIMVSWLAKFNPIFMMLTSFLVVFLQKGVVMVSQKYKMDDALANIITAIVLFFIIGCEFFINYKIMFKAPKEDK